MSVETPPKTSETPETKLFKESVPQEFHDRGYLKDLLDKPDTPETRLELYKKLDGAQTLIGKKTLIPGADAKPEDWDGFFEKLRPAKPEEYEIAAGEKPDEGFIGALRAAAHAGGLGKTQLSRFIEKLSPFLQEREKLATEERKKKDAEFDKLVADTFSDQGKAKLERARAIVKENVPPNLQGFVDRLDNNGLAILAGVVDSLAEKYMSEDDLKNMGKGRGASGTDPVAMREEAKALMNTPEYKDPMHPKHEETVKRARELYQQYHALTSQAKK